MVNFRRASTLSDPDSTILPADAFRELAKRNAALLAAPKAEIQATLARQIVLLEAASVRYMTRAAITTKPDHASVLLKLGLGCSRALLSALAALNSMERDDNSKAIDGALA